MRYHHQKPVAEAHRVDWDLHDMPGIYEPDQKRGFGQYVRLHPDLTAWLDDEAPGWVMRSDWDYSNAGHDDEGCHLTVPTAEAAHAFIGRARAMSDAWVEADRAAMRFSLVLETPDGEAEIERSHRVPHSAGWERQLHAHLVLDRQPMRAHVFRAIREALMEMDATPEDDADVSVAARLDEADLRTPGVRVVVRRRGAAETPVTIAAAVE